ncbi:GtrA family protein [Actinomyces culturomici]|uniref:GtrA family protein n=1 Tax=Actinomyces culturomici TaxID=1926276 RepID=UPI000E20C803|nr:GtrA family protein [Actinomyces culturomici]
MTTARPARLLARFTRQLRYLASSLSSTALDYAMLLALNALVGGILLPVVVARISSCTMNYLINRRVFEARGRVLLTGLTYAAWEATIMLLAYLSITGLVAAGLPLWIASIGANSSLFALNYLGQRTLVFGSRELLAADVARLASVLRVSPTRALARA